MVIEQRCRARGFTLIELLVVIALIGILAGLLIAFIPSFNTRSRAARGAQYLQTWLNGARQRAIRDQSPRGLRISFDANGIATKCQFIEQPDDLGGGRFLAGPAGFANLTLDSYTGPPQPDGAGNNIPPERLVVVTGANFLDDTVQVGDYLEVNGAGQVHFISDIRFSNPPTNTIKNLLVLALPLPTALASGASVKEFRIQHRPRLSGDEVLEMPDTVIIDGSLNTLIPNGAIDTYAPNAEIDVLFAPSGGVIQRGFTKPYIVFWVRSTDDDDAYPAPNKYFRNEPSFIVVYMNSGLVASYAVDSGNPANPYGLIRP